MVFLPTAEEELPRLGMSYGSLRVRGAVLVVTLGIMAALSIGRGFAHFERGNVLADTGDILSRTESLRVDDAEQLLGQVTAAWFIGFAVTAVVTMAFLHRATGNLRSFGHRPRTGAVWAIFSWIIPVISWYLPKRMVNDAWRGADARRAGWVSHKVPGTFLVWWLAYLIGLALTGVPTSSSGRAPSEVRINDQMSAVGSVLLAVSALCAIFVFRSIARRHTERAEVLRQAHAPIAPAVGFDAG